MSSLMCCTSTRSQKVMGQYKDSQKKFLWLDPNRWSGQKTVKKEKVIVQTRISYSRPLRARYATKILVLGLHSW